MNKLKKEVVKKKILQYLLISFGVILLDLGFYFFLDPVRLVTGGMLGVATLLEPALQAIGTWFTTSIFLYIVNILVLILGGLLLGRDFFLKTIYASLFSPTILFILERTCDANWLMANVSDSGKYLVAAICGSILIGGGIGLTVRNNGCTGGMDIVQRILSKYLKIPMSKTMYLTDWVVVAISGFAFGAQFSYNIEMVLYGSISVFIVSYAVDYVALNARTRRTAYIITDCPEQIKQIIFDNISRGATLTKVEGGYTGIERTMVICTLEKNEAYRLLDYVKEADPKAFTFITSCKEVLGEYGRNKPL